jgi:hypothetical protein
MIENSRSGVSYGVEVRDDHPRAEWRIRYGWFPEEGGHDGKPGMERAKVSRDHAVKEYAAARIVKRTTLVEVVEEE